MNRIDEAHAEMEKFVDMSRSHMLEGEKEVRPITLELALDRASRYRIPAERNHFLEGLHKAGLPE